MKIIGKLVELYLIVGRVVLKVFGYKMGVVLKKHEIELKAIKPDTETESERYFDPDHYTESNLYVENYSNPVKINDKSEELELISSSRYKKFFDMKILDAIARLSEGALKIKGWKLIAVLVGINTSISLMMFLFLFGA